MRRSSPNFSPTSWTSSTTTSRIRSSLASRSFRSAIFARTSASSFSTRSAVSRAVSARSRISRIALAWSSLSSKRSISWAARRCGVRRAADDGDDLVEVVESDREAFEEVRTGLGLGEVVGGPPDHDLASEVDEVSQRLLESEQLRSPVYERQHVRSKGRLQRRHLVELVEDDVPLGVAPKLDHDAHAFAVRFVAQIGDAVDAPLADELRDALEQRRLVDHEGDLGHDDPRAALRFLEARARTHGEEPPTGRVGGANSLALPQIIAPVGKSGPGIFSIRSSRVQSGL